MKSYVDFMSENLDSESISKASKSLKKISHLLINKIDPSSIDQLNHLSYVITGLSCGFDLWFDNLIELREKYSIKKSADVAAQIVTMLTKIETIGESIGASIILQDFYDEERPSTKVSFSIKTSDLLNLKVQKFLDEN